MDRRLLMSLADNDEDRVLIARIIDLISDSENKNILRHSDFLNGHQLGIASRIAKSFNISYAFFGGYDDAERQIMLCYPDYWHLDNSDIPVMVITVATKNHTILSHRDYMGAVLNLGIKREKIGDIVVCDDMAYIICMQDISEYITSQITKIGNCGVILKKSSFDDIKIPPKRFKEIEASCNSVRLDAVVCSGFGLSRAEADSLIRKGLVRANWEVKQKSDYRVNEGEIVSAQGYGRIMLYKIGGTSKKGRTFITIRKYI